MRDVQRPEQVEEEKTAKLSGTGHQAQLSYRIQQAIEEIGVSMDVMSRRMPGVLSATLDCCSGDFSRCKKTSVVCRCGSRNNWWLKSSRQGYFASFIRM